MEVTEFIVCDGKVWEVEPGTDALSYENVSTGKAWQVGDYWTWVDQQGGSDQRMRTYRNISTARDIQLGYSRLRKEVS